MSPVYYNENDPGAAAWLRELIKEGEIPDGEVDERDIRDVRPVELRGFAQHHFFAGIGVWARAAREAGWPADRPLWTGSCPCQPFSAAGKGSGFDDERHLWPAWFWLIRQYRPDVVFGEQVASPDGLAWLDLVSTDLEGEGYACGPSDTCSAGFGAPHIRQRLYFAGLADSGRPRSEAWVSEPPQRQKGLTEIPNDSSGGQFGFFEGRSKPDRLADTNNPRPQGRGERRNSTVERASREDGVASRPGPTNGHWRSADWLFCRDGKWRPVEPGTFPLAHGVAGRMGLLRGYGNAINLQQAKAFIEAVMDYQRASMAA